MFKWLCLLLSSIMQFYDTSCLTDKGYKGPHGTFKTNTCLLRSLIQKRRLTLTKNNTNSFYWIYRTSQISLTFINIHTELMTCEGVIDVNEAFKKRNIKDGQLCIKRKMMDLSSQLNKQSFFCVTVE